MIVRGIKEVKASGGFTEQVGLWSSARYLLQADNVGFTLTMTTVAAGQRLELEYQNHLEANMIIEGSARLTDVAAECSYELGAGDMYALDKNDRHILQALSDLKIVCVFTPALIGNEKHDANGSYPATV